MELELIHEAMMKVESLDEKDLKPYLNSLLEKVIFLLLLLFSKKIQPKKKKKTLFRDILFAQVIH